MKARAPHLKSRRLPGPKAEAWVTRDHSVISTSYTRAYPLVVDHGNGAELTDVDGNVFLDMNAGIAVGATGHSHPAVVEAIKSQAEKFLHMSGTDFYYPQEIKVAERLNEIVPGKKPKRTFLSNSGAEAMECAIKLARHRTGRQQFIAFIGAFHGRTMGSLSLTGSKAIQKKGFAPTMPGVTHVPYGDCRRCTFNLKFPSCNLYCVSYIEEVVFKKLVPPEDTAAIVVEPIQGEGGYIIPPPGYHQKLQLIARKYGILLVMDEVQTGMGRTGKWFGIEHWPGVEPDIVAIAKGIASGLPLGATVAPKDLMTWPPGSHGNTFGGNPVSCAAALATMDLIENGLLENARKIGALLAKELAAMMERHEHIGWVNAIGLMIGIEMVAKPGTNLPAPEMRDAVELECYKRGVLVLGAGPSAVRMAPPLLLTRAQAQVALEVFEDAVTTVEQSKLGRTQRAAKRPVGRKG
ncbi:MAG: acetyl ornithine aminotransferase family protein [Candidatus Eiseniibacteriota bacterium]